MLSNCVFIVQSYKIEAKIWSFIVANNFFNRLLFDVYHFDYKLVAAKKMLLKMQNRNINS
jgi:hypothetical protein